MGSGRGAVLSTSFERWAAVQVSGQDKSDLLLALTGAFNSLDLRVCSASIASNDEGRVLDVFRITDMQDQKACVTMSARRSKSMCRCC